MRQWTPAERKRQSELIRARKPWLRSTGPRTDAGKKKSSLNALKTGRRAAVMVRIRTLLRQQRAFMRLHIAASNARYAQRRAQPLELQKNRVFLQTNYYDERSTAQLVIPAFAGMAGLSG